MRRYKKNSFFLHPLKFSRKLFFFFLFRCHGEIFFPKHRRDKRCSFTLIYSLMLPEKTTKEKSLRDDLLFAEGVFISPPPFKLYNFMISDQVKLRAKLKHISKRRKRN